MGTLALILIPAALFLAAVIGVLALRDGRASGRAVARIPGRWIVLSTVLLLLGLLVAPRLLGFTFLLLPFVWMGRAGRRRRPNEDGPR